MRCIAAFAGSGYADLLRLTRQILKEAQGVLQEVESLPPRKRKQVQAWRQQLATMTERVGQVVKQTQARIFKGLAKFPDKIVSLFEPHTEIIRKGEAGKPHELGSWSSYRWPRIRSSRATKSMLTGLRISGCWFRQLRRIRANWGRVLRLVAADAGYYSRSNEEAAKELGVKYVSIPNRTTKSVQRGELPKRRWFRNGQRWRTGCEGRISTVKRRHGLARCRYHGIDGMQRWVGMGVIADNLINIGKHLVACLA
jgi:IS5 family transposase